MGSGLRQRPTIANGQLNDFRRPHETHGGNGRAKSRGNNQMAAAFHDMPIDQIRTKVRNHEILGDHGQVHLATMRMAAKRQGNAVWNASENDGFVRQQDDGRLVVDLRQGPAKIVETPEAPPP